ncbi:hypothetical protein C0J52_23213 [Blattella germanica]|nr:hypothetical protein C0J52_23213 [Blattella germanica]
MIVDLESLFIFLECSLLFIYACIYIHFRNARDKWKQLGVHTLTSTDKFGNFVNTFLSKLETRKRVTLLYQSFRGHAVGGLYTLGSPTLLVLDPASVRYALRLERWPTAHGVRLTRRLEFNISNLSSTVFETLLNCSSELKTLRKYAPVSEIRRCCSTQTVLPGCNVTIEGGTQVQIPVLGLHNDPRFFPEPERFDPDRLRHIRTTNFLGFGAGSGSCTGSEFALLQMKVGLLYILRNHFIYTSHKTPKYNTDLFPLNEIWLTIARREKKEHN